MSPAMILPGDGDVTRIFSEHLKGVDLDLNLDLVEAANAERIRTLLREVAAALEARKSIAL